MALIKKEIKHLQHPTEPETWVDVRLPLSGGNLEGGNLPSDVVASVVTAWSYEGSHTGEAIRDLDVATYQWLVTEVWRNSGLREPDEKKDSSSPSSLTSEPAADDSPMSSATS